MRLTHFSAIIYFILPQSMHHATLCLGNWSLYPNCELTVSDIHYYTRSVQASPIMQKLLFLDIEGTTNCLQTWKPTVNSTDPLEYIKSVPELTQYVLSFPLSKFPSHTLLRRAHKTHGISLSPWMSFFRN